MKRLEYLSGKGLNYLSGKGLNGKGKGRKGLNILVANQTMSPLMSDDEELFQDRVGMWLAHCLKILSLLIC